MSPDIGRNSCPGLRLVDANGIFLNSSIDTKKISCHPDYSTFSHKNRSHVWIQVQHNCEEIKSCWITSRIAQHKERRLRKAMHHCHWRTPQWRRFAYEDEVAGQVHCRDRDGHFRLLLQLYVHVLRTWSRYCCWWKNFFMCDIPNMRTGYQIFLNKCTATTISVCYPC